MTNISHIFGTVMLSLILLTGSLYAFAQDDDEEKEEQEQPEEEEQQQEESKDEEEEENESKEEESSEEEQITNETIQETAQQIIQTELDKAGITTTNESQPVANPPQEVITSHAQPVANDGMQFDATCNCTTPIKSTTTSSPQQQPIMQPITPQQAQTPNVIEQIPITSSNILSSKSLGKVVDPGYTNYYTVSNLFDNVVNDVSFWSQAGNSGFSVKLDRTLDGYQVCSIELNNIHNPKNVPYLVDVGVSKNYSGIIDQANERIQFDNCVKNMDQILMVFNSGNLISNDFISIGELKLFGSKLGGADPQPTPTPPQPGPYKNATKINISNSDAQIDIKNSTITLKFDKNAAQATNYNVITIPDANVVK